MRTRFALMPLLLLLLTGCAAAHAPGQSAAHIPAPPEKTPVLLAITSDPTPAPTPVPTPAAVPLTLRFVGDLMCCTYQMKGAKTGSGYDFFPPFALVADELAGADLLCGNYETNHVPAEPYCGDKSGFNAPTEYLDAVKRCGFDVLFTANNHALDYGVSGALTTLDAIRSRGFTTVGTNASPGDVEKTCIVNVNGLSVALLAYADRTNKKTVELDGEEAYWAFNYFTPERLTEDVVRARAQGAELIVMYLHEGREKITEPNSDQKRAAEAAFAEGVDVVVMSHTHSLLTMEKREIETPRGIKTVFCAYGLGNFMSSAIHNEALNNVILNLNAVYDRTLQGLSSADASYVLTYTYNYYDEHDVRQFRIVPMEQALSDFSLIDPRCTLGVRRLNKAYHDMRRRLDAHSAARSVSSFSTEGAK